MNMWPNSVKMPKALGIILGFAFCLLSIIEIVPINLYAIDTVDGAILPFLIAGGAMLAGSIIQSISANKAAKTQAAAAQAGITEQQRQFNVMQEQLSPYTQAGVSSLTLQQDLMGANGPEAQQRAIAAIQSSPEMAAMVGQGENAMLQNAAATGGLRGGNLQGALAQFRPQVLSSLITNRFNQLGNITQLGQASATGVGSGALQTGANISNLLQQQGAAQAGGQLSTGQIWSQLPSNIAGMMSGGGMF
jgi:hypothetical protein